jgi:hypothetical protein
MTDIPVFLQSIIEGRENRKTQLQVFKNNVLFTNTLHVSARKKLRKQIPVSVVQ